MGTSPWGEGTRTFLSEASLTDTHTRSPATPTPPAFHRGEIPIRFSVLPIPTPPGAGAVRGDRALSGSPPGSPRGVGHGGYRHGGRGPGSGLVPSPGKMVPESSSPATPTPPALRAPPPPRGRGQSGRYPVGSRARDGAGGSFPGGEGAGPYPVLLRDLSMEWTVAAITMGGGDRRGGFPTPQAGTRRPRGCKPPDRAKHDR